MRAQLQTNKKKSSVLDLWVWFHSWHDKESLTLEFSSLLNLLVKLDLWSAEKQSEFQKSIMALYKTNFAHIGSDLKSESLKSQRMNSYQYLRSKLSNCDSSDEHKLNVDMHKGFAITTLEIFCKKKTTTRMTKLRPPM